MPGPSSSALSSDEATLRIAGLTAAYDGPPQAKPRVVFEDLELEVPHGQILAIAGESGVGKTTLLKCMIGLEHPRRGTVRPGPHAMAFVFQKPSLFPWASATQNAAFGLRAQGLPEPACRERARALLTQMNLADHLEDRPHELSEGMKQRVNLARALLVEPAILLLDEPFSALDLGTRRSLTAELLRRREERPFTIVFVSHSLDEIAELADRVIVLRGSPATIVSDTTVDVPRPRLGDEARRVALFREEQRLAALVDAGGT